MLYINGWIASERLFFRGRVVDIRLGKKLRLRKLWSQNESIASILGANMKRTIGDSAKHSNRASDNEKPSLNSHFYAE